MSLRGSLASSSQQSRGVFARGLRPSPEGALGLEPRRPRLDDSGRLARLVCFSGANSLESLSSSEWSAS